MAITNDERCRINAEAGRVVLEILDRLDGSDAEQAESITEHGEAIEALNSSIAETLQSGKEYSDGDYAIVNGKLCKMILGEWVEVHLADEVGSGGTTIDDTLSIHGAAADAKAAGDAIALKANTAEVLLIGDDGKFYIEDDEQEGE